MDFIHRWQEETVRRALEDRRVVVIGGARQVGKTTLAKNLAIDAEYRTLDDVAHLRYAEEDPVSFLRSDRKTLIVDEIQRAVGLLPYVKMAVDEDPRPGRFLLTGSANIQTLPTVTESLAGRVQHIQLSPMTQGEILGRRPNFLLRLFECDFAGSVQTISRRELLKLLLRGGFPEVLHSGAQSRQSWHLSYVDAIVSRDARTLSGLRRQDSFEALVRILAAWSTKILNLTEIGAAVELSTPTLRDYLLLLQRLYLVRKIMPWGKTDYALPHRNEKFILMDCGLMSSLLHITAENIGTDGKRLGKLVETFVANELEAQVHLWGWRYKLTHWRDSDRMEIDFLLEDLERGAICAIEVKAGQNICSDDFEHIRWFRANLAKNRPFTGVVLYGGNLVRPFGEGLVALPIGSLWGWD
jgi:predicted AAA+ superfamily ATPase